MLAAAVSVELGRAGCFDRDDTHASPERYEEIEEPAAECRSSVGSVPVILTYRCFTASRI
jgi:hypothetical protein